MVAAFGVAGIHQGLSFGGLARVQRVKVRRDMPFG